MLRLQHGYKAASSLTRYISTKPIIRIPKSSIHPFGDPSNQRPILQNVDWTINEDEAWAVMSASSGDSGKSAIFQTLLGHLRILSDLKEPLQHGLYPFLGKNIDPYSRVSAVSFSHRSNRGGAFYDYTARYGAIRDEDALTLRESMFPESIPEGKPDPLAVSPFDKPKVKKHAFEDVVKLSDEDKALFDSLVKEMDLERLLDLPLIALSNGQTRRARIVRAVLARPEILLLDEPLTGLDVSSRPKLLNLLHKLHQTRKPRVVLGLRTQDDIPEWVTHVALVQDGTVKAGVKNDVVPFIKHNPSALDVSGTRPIGGSAGSTVLDLRSVTVKYGDRTVLDNLTWQVRQGERWHLQGVNGSGKTTLMSLILGDHPQSYVQSHLLLPSPPDPAIPSKFVLNHRKRIPTAHLRQSIGVVSPELFDAFPRRHGPSGMSVWEAIGTGFEGVFVPLPGNGIGANLPEQKSLRDWRKERMWDVLENLGPSAWKPSEYPRELAAEFAQKKFTDLSVGEQRLVLLMRTLVGRPPIVLLDEVWSGMNEEMVNAAKKYLRERVENDQAVVLITHWEDEVPWTQSEGLKRFRLEEGKGILV